MSKGKKNSIYTTFKDLPKQLQSYDESQIIELRNKVESHFKDKDEQQLRNAQIYFKTNIKSYQTNMPSALTIVSILFVLFAAFVSIDFTNNDFTNTIIKCLTILFMCFMVFNLTKKIIEPTFNYSSVNFFIVEVLEDLIISKKNNN